MPCLPDQTVFFFFRDFSIGDLQYVAIRDIDQPCSLIDPFSGKSYIIPKMDMTMQKYSGMITFDEIDECLKPSVCRILHISQPFWRCMRDNNIYAAASQECKSKFCDPPAHFSL